MVRLSARDRARTVIIFEEGAERGRELSSAVEATLRHASRALRVEVATEEAAVAEHLATSDPALLIVDFDRSEPLAFERLVADLRADEATRWLPVLALVSEPKLPTLQESLRLTLVDFILKPFERGELWSRIRVCFHQSAALAELQQRNDGLARQSLTDDLTGLPNSSYIVDRCDQEVGRAERYAQPVSCLLVDVDRFKAVNDTFGHPVGNEVLRGLGSLLRANVRNSDVVGRYGGEEFLLILPQTGRDGAMTLAERLRVAVESSTFAVGHHRVQITVSIGVATFPSHGVIGRETLFLAVDRAAYRAKSLGRNRVAWSEDEAEAPGGSAEPTPGR